MCGIIYIKDFKNKPVSESVLKHYEFQKSRGTKGFGYVAVREKTVNLERFMFEDDMKKKLEACRASEILFHHRQPTSNDNNARGNHPIMIDNEFYQNKYYLVHNGHISNYSELRKEHEELGAMYSSIVDGKENDSEALAHELALLIEGAKKSNEFSARGSMAFIMLQTNRQNVAQSLYYGRGYSSQLVRDDSVDDYVRISSIGDGKDIMPNRLFKFDYNTKEISDSYLEFNYSTYTTANIHREYIYEKEEKKEVIDKFWNPRPYSDIQVVLDIIKRDGDITECNLNSLDKRDRLSIIREARLRMSLLNINYEYNTLFHNVWSKNDADSRIVNQLKNIELVL